MDTPIESSAQSEGRSRWWRIGALIFLAYLCCYVDRNNISMAASNMMQHLGMSGTSTGVLLSAFFWGYVITQIPGGWVSNRFGAKRVIVACLLGVSVTGLLTGLVHDYRALLAVRFVMGLFEGVIWPSFAVVIMQWFPADERSRAVNLAQYVLPLSSALMAPIAGWMIANFGWQQMFILQAVPVLVLAVAWVSLGSSKPEQDKRISTKERQHILATRERETSPPAPLVSAFTAPVLWGLCLAYFLWMTGFYGFGLWLPSLIKQISSQGVASVALLTALPFAFAVVGLYINAKWADKAKKHAHAWHFIVPLCIGGVAMLTQSAFDHNLLISMVLLVITGVCLISGIGVWWAWALSLVPRNQVGPAAGMINFLGNFGGIVGPIVVGMAAGSGALNSGFHVVGFGLIGSALVNLVVWRLNRSHKPAKGIAVAH